ncbi:MAG: hypothetical protein IPO60_06500 [Flavobacteriales bacterium]|nr:hypothetical protein [Flavobacteriales bacterium]
MQRWRKWSTSCGFSECQRTEHLAAHAARIAGAIDLDADERAALVAFMRSLTDPEFLNNPALSDPH